MAECAVKVAKRTIRKALETKQDRFPPILEYRNVPTQDTGMSPAQKMFGRMTRTLKNSEEQQIKPQGK